MNPSKIKWLYLIILACVWGSSFILIKRGLVGLSPFQLGSLRILFAASFLLIIGFRTLPNIPQSKWKFIVISAVCGLSTLLIGVSFFGLYFQRRQVIGVIVGLIGSALLILNGAANHPEQNYYYAILVIIACLGYATNVNLIKKYMSDLSPLTISTGNFLVLTFPALAVLFFSGFFDITGVAEVQQSVMYILILGVVGTGIANIIFFKLIQISSPVFATSVTYLIPVVAFFWGLMDNESLTVIQFIGALIILAGVYLSARK